jgi:hypothetical protein
LIRKIIIYWIGVEWSFTPTSFFGVLNGIFKTGVASLGPTFWIEISENFPQFPSKAGGPTQIGLWAGFEFFF